MKSYFIALVYCFDAVDLAPGVAPGLLKVMQL